MPDQFILAISCFIATPVRIADQPRRIQHQNHALRSIQNFLVEIALALQLRLEHLLFRHIQHQSANLHHLPQRIAHRADILHRVQQPAVLLTQRLFVIPQRSALRNRAHQPRFCRRRGIKMRTHVRSQQLFRGLVPQHAHQRIIYIQELSLWRGKKQSFLNTVKQLAIPSLSLPPVGNILQHVDRSRFFLGHSSRPRRRNQKRPPRARRNVFFPRLSCIAAERAGQRAPRFRNMAQAADGLTHQRRGRNPKLRRQRPVRPHNLPSLIMHRDVIADRVNVLDPLLFRPLQLRKPPPSPWKAPRG